MNVQPLPPTAEVVAFMLARPGMTETEAARLVLGAGCDPLDVKTLSRRVAAANAREREKAQRRLAHGPPRAVPAHAAPAAAPTPAAPPAEEPGYNPARASEVAFWEHEVQATHTAVRNAEIALKTQGIAGLRKSLYDARKNLDGARKEAEADSVNNSIRGLRDPAELLRRQAQPRNAQALANICPDQVVDLVTALCKAIAPGRPSVVRTLIHALERALKDEE